MVLTTRLLPLMVACIHSSWAARFWGSQTLDCGVSLWSEWTVNPGGSTRTRTRLINQYPPLIDTQTNPWDPNHTSREIAPMIESNLLSSRVVTNSTNGRRRRQTSKQDVVPRDILFLVDMSGSIGSGTFNTVKDKIAALVGKICGEIGPGTQENRMAVVTFSHIAVINFDFSKYSKLEDVQNAVEGLPYESGSTCLSKGLEQSLNVFDASKDTRGLFEYVNKLVILTDGGWNCHSNEESDINKYINKLRGVFPPISIYAFVIGVSDSSTQTKFEDLVTSPIQNHLFAFVNMATFFDTVDYILAYGSDTIL